MGVFPPPVPSPSAGEGTRPPGSGKRSGVAATGGRIPAANETPAEGEGGMDDRAEERREAGGEAGMENEREREREMQEQGKGKKSREGWMNGFVR